MSTFTSAPGVEISWEATGDGRPLVLIHGWAMSRATFADQRRTLAPHAHVVTYDLRGHGCSTARANVGYAIEDHAHDLIALFEHLELRGALLIGWSMGGQIALEALPRLQPRLAGIALLSSTPRFTVGGDWPHGLLPTSVQALAARWDRRPRATLERFFDGMFSPDELSPERRAALRAASTDARPSPEAARGGLEALLAADQRRRLDEIQIPALFIHGERDPICLPGASRFAAARVDRAQLYILPATGHAPHLSRTTEVNQLLLHFMEELPGLTFTPVASFDADAPK